MPRRTFVLAPMDATVATLTVVVILLTIVALGGPLLGMSAQGAPPVVLRVATMVDGAVAALVAALFAFVWLVMRPHAFDLSEEGLRLRWPVRAELVPLGQIEGAELISRRELTARFGRGYRIGAGGLWGGFGLYQTPKQTFRLYISRLEPMVLVHVRASDGRSLLLTPKDPEQFVELLRRLVHPG